MNTQAYVIVENLVLGRQELSDATDPDVRAEEDQLFAMFTLGDIRDRLGTENMMVALPEVARIANCNREALLEKTVAHYAGSWLAGS